MCIFSINSYYIYGVLMKKYFNSIILYSFYLFSFLIFFNCGKDDTVANNPAPPSDKPEVSFLSPNENSELIDSVSVEIKATDNKGITKVEFIVNNQIYKSWVVPPYSFTWNLKNYNDSTLVAFYAKAYDADSNFSTTKVYNLVVRKLFAPYNLIMNNYIN